MFQGQLETQLPDSSTYKMRTGAYIPRPKVTFEWLAHLPCI